ncbi:hypothetical protein FF1_031539 [Malus domestica]
MDEIRQMIANLVVHNDRDNMRNNNDRQLMAGGDRTLGGPRLPNEVDSSSEDEKVMDQLRNIIEETKKFEISTFSGTTSIEDFLDWLSECEKFFAYAEIAEARQVKVVAWKLKGSAVVWWDEQQAARVGQGKQPVRSWRKMQSMLRDRFLPRNYEQVLFEKYHGCVQGTRSVQEYSQEFFNLAARNRLIESLLQQTARYLHGLNANIRDRIGLQCVKKIEVISSLGTERIGAIRPMPTVRTRPRNGNNKPRHPKIQQKPPLEALTIFRILLVDQTI